MKYKVHWCVEISEASSPHEAACFAREIQLSLESTATFFAVVDNAGVVEIVDVNLDDVEGTNPMTVSAHDIKRVALFSRCVERLEQAIHDVRGEVDPDLTSGREIIGDLEDILKDLKQL